MSIKGVEHVKVPPCLSNIPTLGKLADSRRHSKTSPVGESGPRGP